MPCWTIHLGVANKLNENYKLNKEQFLYGSILPDVMDTNPFGRDFSHFFGTRYHDLCKEEIIVDVDRFKSTYEDRLSHDLILGYYVHILTDYFYNDYVFRNCYLRDENNHVIGIKTKEGHTLIPNPNDSRGRRKIKQSDFINYGKLLLSNNLVGIPTDVEEIKKQLHLLESEFITKEEVQKRLDYLSSEEFKQFNSGYLDELFVMCDKDEYQKVFDDCIDFCIEKTKQYVSAKGAFCLKKYRKYGIIHSRIKKGRDPNGNQNIKS